jgi:coiled-coil domain-containing protein 130
MAERKATNKYYPPNWDPSQGSINTFVGQHPLRERAKKLKTEGILVVRFELPFNIWCGGCQNHVGVGVRYNAEKKTIGHYYSTPILSFRMKCHLCSSWIEIHTDPKNAEYIIHSGARKREESFSAQEAGTMQLQTEEEKEKLENDAFYKLEKGSVDQQKAQEALPVLTRIEASLSLSTYISIIYIYIYKI